MKQEFRASRHHLTTVFPVASPPQPPVPRAAAVAVPLSPRQAPSDAAEEERDYDYDDDVDDTSSLEDQTSSHSGSISSRTTTAAVEAEAGTGTGTGGPQAMFLNFTSDLEPHTRSSNKPKKSPAFRVNGVNILNRKNVDSKTAIERMQRRRENHNHVERRRRDNINNTILELSRIIPNAGQTGQKLNKGSVLKLALGYILDLQRENQKLRETNPQLGRTTDEAASRNRADPLTHSESSPGHNNPSTSISEGSSSSSSSSYYDSIINGHVSPETTVLPDITGTVTTHRHSSSFPKHSHPPHHHHRHHHHHHHHHPYQEPPNLQTSSSLH